MEWIVLSSLYGPSEGPDLPEPVLVLIFVVGAFFVLGIAWLLGRLFYVLLTAPLRRRERAVLFLEVLEAAIREGRSPGQAFSFLESRGDRSFGWQFLKVVTCMQDGAGLVDSLRAAPGFLPPRVVEMLGVGERLGDVRAVLPACRQVLDDACSRTRGAIHYFILLVAGGGLVGVPAILGWLSIFIIPKFRAMFLDLGLEPTGLLKLVLVAPLGRITLLALVGLGACVVLYVAGPRLVALALLRLPADLLFFLLPWRRKRMRRDFSTMLALLLDAGVPEAEAATRAAGSTANQFFARRARGVVAALERGEPLGDAIRRIDRAGEFRWRLSNAAHARKGFTAALRQWHEALDAKAEQQEQAAAHVITSALVLGLGCVVGLIAIAFFQPLIQITQRMMLW
ncbi:MAG: type II secretion system F family protein [bacterium]